MLPAPHCPLHVGVAMVELPRRKEAKPRRAVTLPGTLLEVREDTSEDTSIEIPRIDFRCPVAGCWRVATVHQAELTDANRHRCRICGQPICSGESAGAGINDHRHKTCAELRRKEQEASSLARQAAFGRAVIQSPIERRAPAKMGRPGRPRGSKNEGIAHRVQGSYDRRAEAQ